MHLNVTIRPEQPGDIEAISRVTELAFRFHPYSHQTEHLIIDALRRAGALSVSLVAEHGQQVVGHIAFSPVRITDGSRNWFGAGPVSVTPELQRKGIGQQLVRAGLAALRAAGGEGCMLVGDPHFYECFGFAHHPECQLEGVPPEVFLSLAFGPHHPAGHVMFHEAFQVAAPH